MRLTVLGGSSPFVAGLIDALTRLPERLQHGSHLCLHGRPNDHLGLVGDYARKSLIVAGWRVCTTTDLTVALDGPEIVLHQIRYGGLEGRSADEAFAHRWRLPADETLGPAAAHSIVRMLPEFRAICRVLAERCPNAWILNLTNPLSVTTRLLADAGLTKCIGLCELPEATVRQAASRIGCAFDSLTWEYVGLNHRGFVTQLAHDGEDKVDGYLRDFGPLLVPGMPLRELVELHAIPTKTFGLIVRPEREMKSRAADLMTLRERVAVELGQNPGVRPASLGERMMDWYPDAVAPALVAIESDAPHRRVLNVATPEGIVEECVAWVDKTAIRRVDPSPPNPSVARWLAIYRAHEEAQLDAIRNPSCGRFTEAVAVDPLVPRTLAKPIGAALWAAHAALDKI